MTIQCLLCLLCRLNMLNRAVPSQQSIEIDLSVRIDDKLTK